MDNSLTSAVYSIGNELTEGRIVDTNSAYISKKLIEYGLKIVEHITVPDDNQTIIETFKQAEQKKISRNAVKPARTLLVKADEFYKTGDYRSSCHRAEDAIQQLKYLIATFRPDADEIEGRFARITEIHGVVEML